MMARTQRSTPRQRCTAGVTSGARSEGVRVALGEFVRSKAPSLPHPAEGCTWRRFQVLAELAARDLSLGRLAEGHADALSILREAGQPIPAPVSSYGVWAARAGRGETGTVATRVPGGWRLSGTKPYCSGSVHLDRALVTADAPDGYRLFDVSVAEQVVALTPGSWRAVGMADSESETLAFGGPVLPDSAAVGPPDFYLRRPGFWFGSVGVAACWYGGAKGLVDALLAALRDDAGDHALADVGRAVAIVSGLAAYLEHAANAIDADPFDGQGQGHRRALSVREVVHHGCLRALALVAAAGGAGPLCHDTAQARRAADLFVYLAQHHGGRDAAALGQIALDEHG
jgi:alkylation response protein AidB-like acyl-CoA dehydrogenase